MRYIVDVLDTGDEVKVGLYSDERISISINDEEPLYLSRDEADELLEAITRVRASMPKPSINKESAGMQSVTYEQDSKYYSQLAGAR